MFDRLDDPSALAPATLEQRAGVMARGVQLRRRRHRLQVGATALAVLLVVGLFTAFVPRLTRATPDPVKPYGAGAWIAYKCQGGRVVCLMRPDGTEPHRISPRLPRYRTPGPPEWSPDGSQLLVAISDYNRLSPDPVVALDPDGSHLRRLFACADCLAATWSFDGQQVAYVDRRANQSVIRVFNLDTATSHTIARVSEDRGGVYAVHWSPDGRFLVLSLSRVGGTWAGKGHTKLKAVAVVDVPPTGLGDVRVITDPDLRAVDPDWSPDGSRIVFAANPVNRSGGDLDSRWCHFGCSGQNLYTMNPDGSDITALTGFVGETLLGPTDTFMSASQPRWTSDGGQVVFTVTSICRGDPSCPGNPDTARAVQTAFIAADGSGLVLLPVAGTSYPVLRPLDGD